MAGRAVALAKTLEVLTHSPIIGRNVGTFVSPVRLPQWANISLAVAGHSPAWNVR